MTSTECSWRSDDGHGDKANGDEMATKSEKEEEVCRDFLRNVCNRGNRCKFSHTHDANNNSDDAELNRKGNKAENTPDVNSVMMSKCLKNNFPNDNADTNNNASDSAGTNNANSNNSVKSKVSNKNNNGSNGNVKNLASIKSNISFSKNINTTKNNSTNNNCVKGSNNMGKSRKRGSNHSSNFFNKRNNTNNSNYYSDNFYHNFKNGNNNNMRGSRNESGQDSIMFCHDFANGTDCPRSNCRFIHCNQEDINHFRNLSYLSPRAREQCVNKVVGADMAVHFGQMPVCKDHLAGGCRRNHCKFRHISHMQYDLELSYYLKHQPHNANRCRRQGNSGDFFDMSNQQIAPPFEGHESFDAIGGEDKHQRHSDLNFNGNQPNTNPMRSTELLEQENLLLKQRVEELKKQVSDLSTTNEFLLDQNAQLRLKSASSAHVVVSAASAPQPGVSMAVQAMPAISIAATPAVQQAMPPTAPLTMTAAAVEPIPAASYSIAAAVEEIGGQPGRQEAPQALSAAPTLANAAVVCHAPELSNANPPVSSVHRVQETRLVSYPVTSIRQGI